MLEKHCAPYEQRVEIIFDRDNDSTGSAETHWISGDILLLEL